MTHGAGEPEAVPEYRAEGDEPDLPLAETDVRSAARSCSVILLIVAGVIVVALVALVIALING